MGRPPAPFEPVDELRQAVIEARQAVADFEGPPVWKWGKLGSDKDPVEQALWRRITTGRGLGSRLGMASHVRFSEHPLREEGQALRDRLLAIADAAMAEKNAMTERAYAPRQAPTRMQRTEAP